MIKQALIGLAVSALAASAAFGASNNIGATLSKDNRITSIPNGSGHYVAPPAHDPKAKEIFSNVGVLYPKGLYFCCYGNTISGTDSVIGAQYWVAEEFIPANDAKLTEIDVGVGYVTGTNQVTIDLYDDNGGAPGNLIKKNTVTGLGTFGACCTLAVAKVKGVKVTAGTPYWVAVTTEDANDTWDAWNFNSTNQIDPQPIAVNDGAGWVAAGGEVPAPSFAVYGK